MNSRLIGLLRAPYINNYRLQGEVDSLNFGVRYTVRLYDRQTGEFMRQSLSDPATGRYRFNHVPPADKGYFIVVHDDRSDPPLNAAVTDRVTPALDGVPAWELPMLDGRTLSSIATTPSGDPAELVSIRDWEAKRIVANVQPDQTGYWSVTLPSGKYDITYYKEGCAPVCHGPYTILPE